MSRWGGSSNHLQSRYQIFKFFLFFSFSSYCFLFFLHLNNHLHRENKQTKKKHQQEQQNNNNSDNHKMKAHKIQDGLSQSAFVTIAEAEKRQLDRGMPGAFWTVCLHVCPSHRRGIVRLDRLTETANCKMLTISSCCLQLTSSKPAKNSKVGITVWSYGMYPKIGLGDWRLKLSLPPHLIQSPLSPFSPVDSPAEGVWSLIKGQSAAKM